MKKMSLGAAGFLAMNLCVHAQSGYDVQQSRILQGPIMESRTGVSDVNACAAACNGKAGCNSFTYIPSRQICELKAQNAFVDGNVAGYVSGVKASGFSMVMVGDTQYPRVIGAFDTQDSRILGGQILESRTGVPT